METLVGNIYDINGDPAGEHEVFEILFQFRDVKVERIVTHKPYEKPGEWYNQEKDEWVLLLQGEAVIEFEDKKKLQLIKGDYIFIPAHKIHRVRSSGTKEKCVWLAIHGKFK